MCNFFSLVSDGYGNVRYFNSEIRKKILAEKLDFETDSHTSICSYFELPEDKWNKYEYNPLTKEFEIDNIVRINDSNKVERVCRHLDFGKIVPELIIKPIVSPLLINRVSRRITDEKKSLLKEWNSVWNSVMSSVGSSVWNYVGDSVWSSIRNSVRNSVWNSVGDSVWNSVMSSFGVSVWSPARNSVGDSVWSSMYAYISSFFNLKKWKGIESKNLENPFQSCISLWEKGFVPSFDGKIWRLHSGKKAEVVFKISKKHLEKF